MNPILSQLAVQIRCLDPRSRPTDPRSRPVDPPSQPMDRPTAHEPVDGISACDKRWTTLQSLRKTIILTKALRTTSLNDRQETHETLCWMCLLVSLLGSLEVGHPRPCAASFNDDLRHESIDGFPGDDTRPQERSSKAPRRNNDGQILAKPVILREAADGRGDDPRDGCTDVCRSLTTTETVTTDSLVTNSAMDPRLEIDALTSTTVALLG